MTRTLYSTYIFGMAHSAHIRLTELMIRERVFLSCEEVTWLLEEAEHTAQVQLLNFGSEKSKVHVVKLLIEYRKKLNVAFLLSH